MFTAMISTNRRHQYLLLIYICLVHIITFLFVWHRNDAVLSTYIMIFLSFILCFLMAVKRLQANFGAFALLTLTILIQPLETYHYFALKANPHLSSYAYDFSYRSLNLKNTEGIDLNKTSLYYASGGYNFIYQNISIDALSKYLQYKFILVDRLKAIDRSAVGPVLERNFLTDLNMAVVFNVTGENIKLNGNDPNPPIKAQHIDNSSKGFKLLAFDANHLRLALNLPYEKFLIYNDSYDPYWRVCVNNIHAKLYEVNGAFKGTWIPAGKSIIEFSYGCWWQYVMNILLSIFAFIFLIGIIYYAWLP